MNKNTKVTKTIKGAAVEVIQHLGLSEHDVWLAASISGIIARQCVSRDDVETLITAARTDEAKKLIQQLQLTADEAISDASYWKQAARQTQELLDKQTQETKDALDSLKEVEADSEDMERDLDVLESQVLTLNAQLSERDAEITKARETRVHEVAVDTAISRLLNAGVRRLSTENEEHRLASVVFRKALETEKTNNSVLRSQLADMGGPDARIEALVNKCQAYVGRAEDTAKYVQELNERILSQDQMLGAKMREAHQYRMNLEVALAALRTSETRVSDLQTALNKQIWDRRNDVAVVEFQRAVVNNVIAHRDRLEQELRELRAAHRGSEKQVKELGELVNQTKAQRDFANTTVRNITNLLSKP
jgi:chromosome segregation ATPase